MSYSDVQNGKKWGKLPPQEFFWEPPNLPEIRESFKISKIVV